MKYRKIYIISLIMFIFFVTCSAPVTKKSAQPAYDEWLGMYFNNNKLGFIHSTTEKIDTGYKLNVLSYMKMESFGSVQEISMTHESFMTADLRTKSFTLIQEMMGNKIKIKGVVNGDEMEVESISAGATAKKVVPFNSRTFLSSDFILMIIKKGLKVGNTYDLKLFVEPIQATVPAKIKILRKEKIRFKGSLIETFVVEEKMDGLVSTMWLTPQGDTIKEKSFEGFEFRKETRDEALHFKGGTAPVSSLTALTLIKTDSPIDDASGLELLTLAIEMDDVNLLPEDHRQYIFKRENSRVMLRVKTEDLVNKITSKTLLDKKQGFEKYLSADYSIQSTHPEIIKTAKDIIGNEQNTWAAAKKINDWVFSYMEKKPVDAFTSLESLRTKAGECQSHTNLFTALSRSVGIPTKIISGIVYSPYYKGFLYHAWPEVYVGQWVAMDPTLGETVADATHIKLSEGVVSENLDLLKFIGKLKITVIE